MIRVWWILWLLWRDTTVGWGGFFFFFFFFNSENRFSIQKTFPKTSIFLKVSVYSRKYFPKYNINFWKTFLKTYFWKIFFRSQFYIPKNICRNCFFTSKIHFERSFSEVIFELWKMFFKTTLCTPKFIM